MRDRARRFLGYALVIASLVLNFVFLASRTRFALTFGLAPAYASVPVAWWLSIDAGLIAIWIAAHHLYLAPVPPAEETPHRWWRTALLAVALVGVLLSLEAPNDERYPLTSGRVRERGSYPSLLASCVTGDFVYNGDSSGLFGLAKLSRNELRRLHNPLWTSQIGAGRPLYPVDNYTFGTFDPLLRIAAAVSGDTNHFFIAGSILYDILIVAAAFGLLRRLGLSRGAVVVATLLLFASRFLHWYPNFTQTYLGPMAGLLLLLLTLHELLRTGKWIWVWSSALIGGWLFLNTILAVPAAGMATLSAIVAAGVSYRFTRREWLIRSALVVLVLALSMCLTLPHLLPLRLFAAQSTNSRLPYIGQGVDTVDGLRQFASWFASGPVSWPLALLGLISGLTTSGRRFHYVFACCLLTWSLLGFLGAFDDLALKFGYNAQRVCSYGPLATIAGMLLVGIGADTLIGYDRNALLTGIFWTVAFLTYHVFHELAYLRAPSWALLAPIAFAFFVSPRSETKTWSRELAPRGLLALVAYALLASIVSSRNTILNAYLGGPHLRLGQGATAILLAGPVIAGYLWAERRTLWRFMSFPLKRSVVLWFVRPPHTPRRHMTRVRAWMMPLFLVAATILYEDLALRDDQVVSAPIDSPTIEPSIRRVIGDAGMDFRIACLYPGRGRSFEPITYEVADSLPIYPLHAPLYGYQDAMGSMSLTIRDMSDFVDFANYGSLWAGPSSPAKGLAQDNPADLQRRVQMKRIALFAWYPYSGLWKYMALRYFISREPLDEKNSALVAIASARRPITYGRTMEPRVRLENVYVYELKDAYPRVYCPDVVQVVPESSPSDLATLEEHVGPGRFAVVADPAQVTSRVIEQPGPNQARIVSDSGDQLEIEASFSAAGYLVISDSFFPGWVARVDGVEANVLKANYAFRAVHLPAGTHKVVMTFRPSALLRGGLVGGLAAAICLIGLLIAGVKGRRSQRPA